MRIRTQEHITHKITVLSRKIQVKLPQWKDTAGRVWKEMLRVSSQHINYNPEYFPTSFQSWLTGYMIGSLIGYNLFLSPKYVLWARSSFQTYNHVVGVYGEQSQLWNCPRVPEWTIIFVLLQDLYHLGNRSPKSSEIFVRNPKTDPTLLHGRSHLLLWDPCLACYLSHVSTFFLKFDCPRLFDRN